MANCERCGSPGAHWFPFFRGYRCIPCIRWYQGELHAGRWPFTRAEQEIIQEKDCAGAGE